VHTSADSDLSSLLVAVHLVDRIETRALRAALEANIRAGAGGRRGHVELPHQNGALRIASPRLMILLFMSAAVTTWPVPPHLTASSRKTRAAALRIQMVRPVGHCCDPLFCSGMQMNCSFFGSSR